jgi:hypothetical protein
MGILVSALFFTSGTLTSAQAAVWETQNEWNDAWEEEYVRWIQSNWDSSLFTSRDSIYHGLRVDCANAAYSMRMFFAFENKLPFAVNDPSGGGQLISNEMSRFDSETDERKRLHRFAQYIYGITWTRSLPNDSYPIAINRNSVLPGTFYLMFNDRENFRHAHTVKDLPSSGVPSFLYSSQPPKPTLRRRVIWPGLHLTFQNRTIAEPAGFRAFRQPQDLLKNVWDVPGYSNEQYEIPYETIKNGEKFTWHHQVQNRLSSTNETPVERIVRALDQTCIDAVDRIEFVNDALEQLDKMGRRQCMNQREYHNFSTPSRDRRLRGSFDELEEAYHRALENGANLGIDMQARLQRILEFSDLSEAYSYREGDYCPIEYREGVIIELRELRRRMLLDRLSHNPHDPVEYRWGEKSGQSRGQSQRARNCRSY